MFFAVCGDTVYKAGVCQAHWEIVSSPQMLAASVDRIMNRTGLTYKNTEKSQVGNAS